MRLPLGLWRVEKSPWERSLWVWEEQQMQEN